MKKKLAMRIASLALCVVFTGMLFGAPKAKAMGLEVATGSLAVATYLSATGAPLIVTPGASANLVATGISSMASSYVGATGVASSGSAWLSSLAAGVSISPAGMIVLSAAAVIAIGALVAWYVGEKGLTEESPDVTVVPGTVAGSLYGGFSLPSADAIIDSYEASYPYATIYYDPDSGYGSLMLTTARLCYDTENNECEALTSYSCRFYKLESSAWIFSSSRSYSANYAILYRFPTWSNYDVFDLSGSLVLMGSSPVLDVQNQLDITRSPEFTQPDMEFSPESQKQMVIDAGLVAGTTLDAAVEQIPELIIAGDFAPTYEITTEGTGEGTDTETNPDEETGVYIPILSDIKTALGNLGDSIVDGVKGLFVPTDVALDSLSAEVDNKLPFIPDLKAFGSDLAYNLEHPEECVDEMGFTTIVDLGKGRGTELGNAKIDLLDVSWYLEYKPFVDDVIVGFVWLMFLWNLYGELPRIIHGEGSFAKMYGIIEASMKEENGP